MGWEAVSEHFLNSLAKSLTRSEQRPENAGQGSPLSFHWDEKFCKGKSRYRLLLKINKRGEEGPSLVSSNPLVCHPTLPAAELLSSLFFFPSAGLAANSVSWSQSPSMGSWGSHGLSPELHVDNDLLSDTGAGQQGGELADRLRPQLHQPAITLSGQEHPVQQQGWPPLVPFDF